MNALPATLIPEPSDSEDVVSALETADVFWTKGDADEAMRWLKRAAESASDAGNDARALAIARSVADLKSGSSRAIETPSVSRPAPPSAAKAPPPPSATRAGAGTQENSEVRRAPPPLPSPPAAPIDAAPTSRATASQKAPPPLPTPKTPESAAPPAPSARLSSMPPAPPQKRPASTDRLPAVTPEPAHVTPVKPQPTGAGPNPTPPADAARPAPASPQPRAAAVSAAPAPGSDIPAAGNRRSMPAPKEPSRAAVTAANAYRAVTVYVKPQAQNGERLEVFLARPGQTPPPGTEPALLIPTRRGARLLG